MKEERHPRQLAFVAQGVGGHARRDEALDDPVAEVETAEVSHAAVVELGRALRASRVEDRRVASHQPR